ncbi:MAG TPA: sigma-70 family RNA polymerase sigma factor [Candidatus Limnocylindrales bacterium]
MRAQRRERFEAIYRENRQDVLAFLLRRCAQPADAADLLHEVFVVAWRRIKYVPEGVAARMWLFGVAHRILANHRRAVKRRNLLVQQLGLEVSAATAPPEYPHVHEALAALSEQDRAIVTMSAWERLTPSEIAVVIEMDPGAVRVRLHRARERLRQHLATSAAAVGG